MRVSSKSILCLVISAVAIAAQCHASGRKDFPSATKVIEEALEAKVFPGCTLVVGTETNLLWSDAFGYFDYEHGQPVRTDTMYDLASVTKVSATTSTYMRLVALGKLRVTDPVSKYLPEFIPGASTEEEKAQRAKITVEHLLTHTAGLVGWKPFYREVTSHEAIIAKIIATPLEAPPGVRFKYSDLGMMLLGEIAGRAGGKKLPDLAQELVFGPLKMTNTMFTPPPALIGRIPPTEKLPGTNTFVHGVVHDENARAGDGRTGHAGLFSTAEDLSTLAQEILRGLEGRSKLFPREVVSEFVRNRKMAPDSGRALGWGLGEEESADGTKTRYISHNGFTGTYIRINLDQKLFVIHLSNRVHPTRDNDGVGRVRSKLLDAIAEDIGRSSTKTQ